MAFRVYGPIPLIVREMIDEDSKFSFSVIDLNKSKPRVCAAKGANEVGIYVFAVRRQAGSMIPWYVGKTEKKTLAHESITADKLRKYAEALGKSVGGRPVLFFIPPGDSTDEKLIDDLEQFLIWLGRQRNPRVLNKRKVKLSPIALYEHLHRLSVYGVVNSPAGNPWNAAKLRICMGWDKPMHVVAGATS